MNKTLSIILLVVGVVVVLLSLGADVLGIGGAQAFGYKQVTGVVEGCFIVIVGLVFLFRQQSG